MVQNALEILTSQMVEKVLNSGMNGRQKILKVKGEQQIWNIAFYDHVGATAKMNKTANEVGFPGIIFADGRQEDKNVYQGLLLTKSGGSFGTERPRILLEEQNAVIDMLGIMLREIGRKGYVRLDDFVL